MKYWTVGRSVPASSGTDGTIHLSDPGYGVNQELSSASCQRSIELTAFMKASYIIAASEGTVRLIDSRHFFNQSLRYMSHFGDDDSIA